KTQNNLETAWEMVKDYNDNMPQPLPERELKTTFKSIVKKEERTKADLKNLNLDFNYDDIGWTRKFLEYLSQENRNRFCFDADTWYYYDGDVWKIDYKESNVRRKWNTFVEKMRENAEKVTNDKTKNYYLKQIDKATAINKENAVMRKITSLIAQKIEARDFDNDDLILNVWNGTIELGNDIHREHKPEDLLTKTARTNFDQEARAPNWLKFIDDITGGNGELSEYLQTAIGYSATGDRTYHSCFFLYGTGANGKSTFLEVIHEILGDYVRTTDVNCLLSSNSESNNIQYALHNLKGVRMAIAPETAETKKLSEDVIKKLSGGDTVMARAPYGRPIEFQPRFKLWIHGNYKPLIYGDDKGIWRRFKLIPFNQCFDNDSIVLDIKEKLLQEREGILNWILEGVKKWIQNGKKLIEPKCIKSEIEA
ncbi:MAG: hypothetical protein GWN01_17220, partial [Nitrosopumilaceae archaeon]|nr:hypothetical protein [Nitrosopumilaceae archaeon]NIU89034.1 hypothetical protein [Nitrosopumilaceae archaeon]NIV67139.1 hypothetical protein [Nitrosopumilaceae archaeon]NIX63170.1 hypothetical protein [Nitrosopumilaceae archaeon]